MSRTTIDFARGAAVEAACVADSCAIGRDFCDLWAPVGAALHALSTGGSDQSPVTEARDWTDAVGLAWAAEWRRTDRSIAGLDGQLNAAIVDAAPRSGRVIDIGCGAGTTSLTLAAKRADCAVTGVDLSAAMLDVARSRAAGLANLAYREGMCLGSWRRKRPSTSMSRAMA